MPNTNRNNTESVIRVFKLNWYKSGVILNLARNRFKIHPRMLVRLFHFLLAILTIHPRKFVDPCPILTTFQLLKALHALTEKNRHQNILS
jgi:hypothetical protein